MRRHLFLVLLCLALGTATTWIVGVACLRQNVSPIGSRVTETHRDWWHAGRAPDWPDAPRSVNDFDGFGLTTRLLATTVSADGTPFDNADSFTAVPSRAYILEEKRVGWPFRSFRTRVRTVVAYTTTGGTTQMEEAGFEVLHIGGRPGAGLEIPTHPIPLGFTANTLGAAAIFGSLSAWYAFARARRRRERGRCVRCGYGRLELDVCPECGAMDRPLPA